MVQKMQIFDFLVDKYKSLLYLKRHIKVFKKVFDIFLRLSWKML